LKPAIALAGAAETDQWRQWTQAAGWQLIAPKFENASNPDARVQAVAAAVQAAIKDSGVDPARVYLAGRGDNAAAVFYIISRAPDLWAAGLAIGGSPRPALETARIFTANFTNTPVLWIGGPPGSEELAGKLKSQGLNVEWHSATGLDNAALFQMLAQRVRSEFPTSANCETNSPTFARCYWMEPTKFDLNERNESLYTTLLRDGSGAALDLGGFGFKTTDPGPGVLITYLPKEYSGPLKLNDRIVEIDGAPITDARDFLDRMSKVQKPKEVVALIQRGRERIRQDTRIVLPQPGAVPTAHVEGMYNAKSKSVEIVTRAVTEMRVTIPPQWVPSDLFWDGIEVAKLSKPGCYLLSINQEFLNAAPCL
jgi:hypothetical protein